MDTYLFVFLSYLLGSIPFALIIGKLFYKTDIREHGSGNLGGTNTFRVLGKKAGIAVSLGDILKGSAATFIPVLFGTHTNPLLFGLFAIIGHSFPVFAKFKGGKSVATTAGVMIVYQPLAVLIGLIVFITSLKLSKYVSLSSMIASVSLVVFSLFIKDVWFIGVTSFICLFIIYRHRSNLKRIKEKSEPKVKWI